YWCYDRHRSVRLVICFDLAIDQIAQFGLSSLKVIYYSAQLFRVRFHSEKFAQSVSRTWLKFTIRRVSVNSICQ
ncbi:hypothetical protein J8810_24930, partial [Klebsiella pneumoniae]